jgi:hypothetical protein
MEGKRTDVTIEFQEEVVYNGPSASRAPTSGSQAPHSRFHMQFAAVPLNMTSAPTTRFCQLQDLPVLQRYLVASSQPLA